MKNLRLLCSTIVLLGLSACGQTSSPTAIPTIVLGSSQGSSSGETVSASGVIVPEHHAELSFPMTGIVRAVSVNVGDNVKTGQQLAMLDTSVLEAQVAVADANLRAQQISYSYIARSGTDQEHLDASLADVARQQALLDVAKATLAQATLLAPFDGTIASVDTAVAETVVPGQSVITMGDLTRLRVETTDLSERDAPKVQIGQHAEVSVVALGQTFDGKVTDISRVSSTVGGDVVYKVTIEFDSQPSDLLWGMSTNVRIIASG
jgi:membrane fusion protein (multidrug efflux system)